MPGRPIIHAITPGDHFSPRTGSAIPTVVDGLANAAVRDGAPRHAVLVEAGTYQPRYGSADIIEYAGTRGPRRWELYTDALRGRLGLPRTAAAGWFAPLAAALTDRPSSVVLAHNAPVLVWQLRRSHHVPVLYAHNDLLRTYSRAEAGRMLSAAAAIVCVSESLAAATRARLPRSLHDRVRVVRNGVDAERFAPAAARAPGPLRVVFMGRVIPEKGADVLLKAAAQLSGCDAEIIVIGRPGFAADAELSDYERELRALAEASAVPVRFEGFVDRGELPARLQSTDLFVVPSRWPDPAPLTVGEAMATGLPIVASGMGGIPELLGDAGLLVPKDDPAALAEALRALLLDPDRRAAMAVRARSRAVAHDWGWSRLQLESVLEGL